MAIIALEGMHFRAFHGYYPEENITGTDFLLDVYVEADIEEAAETDNLYEEVEEDSEEDEHPLSVNYETIYLLCESEMRKTSKLLETVVQNISNRINEYFTFEKDGEEIVLIKGMRIRLKKMNPPLHGKVDCAFVELSTGVFELPSGESLKKLRNLIKNWEELEDLL
ncbi:MAG: dihydroneopterin aldolase [Saprospiraceae bacterium]|nr:dihydroneopterin aldolase [Saprospiraceae bacterium]